MNGYLVVQGGESALIFSLRVHEIFCKLAGLRLGTVPGCKLAGLRLGTVPGCNLETLLLDGKMLLWCPNG